jgi:hypothetical protein
MNMATTTRSLAENIPTLLGIILIITVAANYFFQYGIEGVGTVRNWLSWALPFAAIVSALLIGRVHVRRITQRTDKEWYMSFVFFGFFFFQLITAWTIGRGSFIYATTYELFNRGATGAVMCMVAFSYVSMFYRTFYVRTFLAGYTMVLGILAIFAISALSIITVPILGDIGYWIINNPAAGANHALWVATYMGLGALIIRVILFREKLRPGV